MSPSDRSADEAEARETAAAIFTALAAAWETYGPVYRQVARTEVLDPPARESAIRTVAGVATTLRRLAPVLATTLALPEEERPDAALVLLRVLTDSLSIALAEHPASDLMVPPDEVDELVRILFAVRSHGRADE